MYLLSAIFSNGGLFVEKGFHYHICANLVVSQEFFFFLLTQFTQDMKEDRKLNKKHIK